MNDKNGVVDDHTDEDHKSQHREDIKGLVGYPDVDEFETEQSAAGGKRYGEHDDDGIDKIPKQRSQLLALARSYFGQAENFESIDDAVQHVGIRPLVQLIGISGTFMDMIPDVDLAIMLI